MYKGIFVESAQQVGENEEQTTHEYDFSEAGILRGSSLVDELD
jgi:hypothetical protein